MSLSDLMLELKKEYVNDLKIKIAMAQSDLADCNIDSLRTLFHKIKGSGKTYGLPEVSLLGETVEPLLDLKSELDDEVKDGVTRGIAILQRIYDTRIQDEEYGIETDPDYTELRSRAC